MPKFEKVNQLVAACKKYKGSFFID